MNIRPLSEALQKVAIEELNEDPKRIQDDLNNFKEWIKEQPHLRARMDDQFLIAFLRGCKYSLEKAKTKLDNFYTFKEKYPELLKRPNLEDPKVRELLRLGIILYLPEPLTEAGPRIVLVRNGAYDPSKYSFAELAQMRTLIQDIVLMEDDVAVVAGIIFVLDFSEVGMSHLFQINPGVMRKVSQYTEKALPLRVKASHFIDTPLVFEPVFNWVKPLMPQKMQGRLYVHGSKREELFKIIPKKLLPKDYGGENLSIQELIDMWEQKVLSYADFFKDDDKYGVDESLRVQQKATNSTESTAGLVGSFRKLVVD
ncbi:alpha-tocopherol transfer protein-like [Stomoxys calcitrans]|uniref:alpha-tocopherol transfer protein-like n=1 Tax=Stomoxys calcitrans TaxID=35570 RepID=UPI0027E332AC|nr:alpha-tocopherol transfer protein-like [Stomoxys calcitrans]